MTLQFDTPTATGSFVDTPIDFYITKTQDGHTTGLRGSFVYQSGDVEVPVDQDVLDVIAIMRDAFVAAGYTTSMEFKRVVSLVEMVEEV